MMMLKLTSLLASPSGQQLATKVLEMVQKENIPLDQGAKDLLDMLNKLQEGAQLSGLSVKDVVEESIALFRQKHGG